MKTSGLCLALLAFSVVAWSAPPSEAAKDPVVVYLVRHAEKVVGAEAGSDPRLSEAGRERSRRLAHVLGDAGITTIWSTDYARTRETVTPLARRLGLEIDVYDPSRLEELASQLRESPGRHLVSGHSNTTPPLVGLLGGTAGDPIVEASEYDRLYVVVIDGESVTTSILRYGDESADEAE